MSPAEETERNLAAARRLRHDLGKQIRFNAPDRLEEEVEALRGRLKLDLLKTRDGPGGTLSAIEAWERWRREEGRELSGDGFRDDLVALDSAMERIRALLPGIDRLDAPGLLELDAASRIVAERCAAIFRRAAGNERP